MSFWLNEEYLRRSGWHRGDICEIYSNSKKKWCIGQITNISTGYASEWFKVQYEGSTKEIQRYSRYIRPIKCKTKLTTEEKILHILKRISQSIKDLIIGFCKQINYNLFIYDMPQEIMNVILLYYDDNYKFNTQLHTTMDNLLVTDRTVKRIQQHTSCTICVFGEEISDAQYEIFNVEIKWKTCVRSFSMGYITSNIYESIPNWNTALANDSHWAQIGIEVIRGNNQFILHDAYSNQKLNYISSHGFKENDIFVVSFDFKNGVLVIYHNGIEADILSLEHLQKITPAFSLSENKGEEIEIIKYYSSF